MTTKVFFDNKTNVPFLIVDTDNNFYPSVQAGQVMFMKLHYSQSFPKQYNLFANNSFGSNSYVSFWINITGVIGQTNTSSGVASLLTSNEGNPYRDNVPTNKVIILPAGSTQYGPP